MSISYASVFCFITLVSRTMTTPSRGQQALLPVENISYENVSGVIKNTSRPRLWPPTVATFYCSSKIIDSVPWEHFKAIYPDTYLARFIVDRIPTLRGARCIRAFDKPLGELLPNGSYTHYLKDLDDGKIDLWAFSFIRRAFQTGPMEFLYPHIQDDYCLVVGRSSALPFMKALGRIFSLHIWFLIGSTIPGLAMVQLIQYHVHRLRPHCTLGRRMNDALFSALSTAVTGSYPVKNGWIMALSVVVAYGYVVLSHALSGSLASLLAVPSFAPDINTLEEVDKRIESIFIYKPGVSVFTSVERGDILEKLSRKFVLQEDDSNLINILQGIRNGKPWSILLYRSYIKLCRNLEYYGESGRMLLYEVPQCMSTPAFKSLGVPKGSPLASRINTIAQRSVESGLYQHFQTRALHNFIKFYPQPGRFHAYRQLSPYSLDLKHLGELFGMFGCSLLLYTVVWVNEIIWYTITKLR